MATNIEFGLGCFKFAHVHCVEKVMCSIKKSMLSFLWIYPLEGPQSKKVVFVMISL